MILQGFKITEWVYFFNQENKNDLNKILNNENNKTLNQEFLTWQLITVLLPLLHC